MGLHRGLQQPDKTAPSTDTWSVYVPGVYLSRNEMFPGGPNQPLLVLFCLRPGPIQRPLPEGEMQPSQGVCYPGLPDCPVCQPQAPAPQVRREAGRCPPAGGTEGTPSLTGGSGWRESRCLRCQFIWCLVPAVLPWFSHTDLQRMSLSLFPLNQLYLLPSPHLSRGTENPFLVITGTVPPPRKTLRSKKLVAKKTGAEPLDSWLPLTSSPG